MLQDSGSRVSHLGPLSNAPRFERVVSGPLNQKPLSMEGFFWFSPALAFALLAHSHMLVLQFYPWLWTVEQSNPKP